MAEDWEALARRFAKALQSLAMVNDEEDVGIGPRVFDRQRPILRDVMDDARRVGGLTWAEWDRAGAERIASERTKVQA